MIWALWSVGRWPDGTLQALECKAGWSWPRDVGLQAAKNRFVFRHGGGILQDLSEQGGCMSKCSHFFNAMDGIEPLLWCDKRQMSVPRKEAEFYCNRCPYRDDQE